MELVKRRQIKIGTVYGGSYCVEACDDVYDPESSMFMYDNRKPERGGYYKCLNCTLRHRKKGCEKMACLRAERKDGKSVLFNRI